MDACDGEVVSELPLKNKYLELSSRESDPVYIAPATSFEGKKEKEQKEE